MYKMRVFAELVYDTDRNLGNALVSPEWHLWMSDFSRAFRLHHDLRDPKNLVKCDRQLLQNLPLHDEKELTARTKDHLTKLEIQGAMEHRDEIVQYFEQLVAQKGEQEVLY
jgi:hypothetical protein